MKYNYPQNDKSNDLVKVGTNGKYEIQTLQVAAIAYYF